MVSLMNQHQAVALLRIFAQIEDSCDDEQRAIRIDHEGETHDLDASLVRTLPDRLEDSGISFVQGYVVGLHRLTFHTLRIDDRTIDTYVLTFGRELPDIL